MNLRKKIKEFLNKNTCQYIDYIGDDDDIKEKYGLDSIQLVEIIIELEEEYNCDLSDMFVCESMISIALIEKYILLQLNDLSLGHYADE